MDNQQLYNLNNEEIQVVLTGVLGDGHLVRPISTNSNSYFKSSCIHKEYIELKNSYFKNVKSTIKTIENNGFKRGIIHVLETGRHPEITKIFKDSLEDNIKKMDELGLAFWLYDDGSLHKTKEFYNINTHKHSKEEQEEILIPYLRRFGIIAKTTRELKKDRREFYYLRISKYQGAYEISEILSKVPIECYKYKLWSSETSQKWRNFQEEVKHERFTKEEERKKIKYLFKCKPRYSPILHESVRDYTESV